MPLSLFILKENPVIRQHLCASVSENPGMVVVGEGAWDGETLSRLRIAQPDCLILELQERSKIPAQVADLREACSRARLLAIAGSVDLEDSIAAIDCGVEGLLRKGSTVADIRSAILKLDLDGTYLDPVDAMQIIGLMYSRDSRRKKALVLELTAREEGVIQDLSDGKSNLEIADRLGISESAVKRCIGTLKEKFGVTERREIVLSARTLALACVTKLSCWFAWCTPVCQESVALI